MTTYLLDSNILIALAIQEHEHHAVASAWMVDVEHFALCPIVEGALVRFLVRLGESASTAVAVLKAIQALPTGEFWPDGLSYAEVDLRHVIGHRQVTDAYLLGLVRDRPAARLATFDAGLAAVDPSLVTLLGAATVA
ncbi:TA system VapC family ribonuclease toxin [Salinibacterium sp.]|uniref:TA system VapC family ribonuclease toxin n=1 Tax=Salinibacterium sp. TaxID=1915057 RepID=UPI002869EE8F|nr:TA system VapC family ribonuclease toxin [Salinibacterium sp.]